MRELGVPSEFSMRLEKKQEAKAGRIIAGLGALLLSIIFSVLISMVILAVGVCLFLIFLASAFPTQEEKVLKEGVSGEDIFKRRLRNILSDDYIALFNLPLPRGGDIDCFVVGPTGAYLLDVKHHKGYILYCNGEWSQVKVGRRGKVYDGDHIKDPSSQVRRGIFEVKKLLREKGINLWIEGVVVFTNPGVRVFTEDIDDGVSVITIDELEKVFQEGKRRIRPEAVEAIASLVYEGFGKGKEVQNGRLSF